MAGLQREAVGDIKNQIGTLMKMPIPIESFHVKHPSDIKVMQRFSSYLLFIQHIENIYYFSILAENVVFQ